jgi:methionyl-tRNA synthetase
MGRRSGVYVWIDALINYTSALTYARPGGPDGSPVAGALAAWRGTSCDSTP